jgi:hypothetical protein
MKVLSGVVIWVMATYSADQYFFYGTYYSAARQILRQIAYRLL